MAIEYALLEKSGLHTICDKVIRVEAPLDTRVDRVAEREWSAEDLRKRDDRQTVVSEVEHTILKNDGSLNDLEDKINLLVKDIKSRHKSGFMAWFGELCGRGSS